MSYVLAADSAIAVVALLNHNTGIKILFLVCVTVAGIFGAITVKRRILWVHALPGAIALVLVLRSGVWPDRGNPHPGQDTGIHHADCLDATVISSSGAGFAMP